MEKIIMHIDVNNAFLSWTAIDLLNKGYNRDIRKINAVIGGDESLRHGIVLAKSMSAKKYGIKTAETLYSARSKCKDLEVFPPNYDWYLKMSKDLFDLIKNYTPDIEIVSCDECYLDYTPIAKSYKSPLVFANLLKYEIYNKLGFTVNVGIANNKLCAKMASDFSKPNKVHTLFKNEIEEKMYPLDVDDLFGVGKKTAAKLHELNIHKIKDLAKTDLLFLTKYFKNQAANLIKIANGIDDSIVDSNPQERKGISRSITLRYNLTNKKQIYKHIEPLVEEIALTLRNKNKYAYVVTINLKDKYFKNFHHQIKLKNATNSTKVLCDIALKLINEMEIEESIRLVGFGVSSLVNVNNYQLSIFEDNEEIVNDEELEKAIDQIKKQYGVDKIIKASQKNVD